MRETGEHTLTTTLLFFPSSCTCNLRAHGKGKMWRKKCLFLQCWMPRSWVVMITNYLRSFSRWLSVLATFTLTSDFWDWSQHEMSFTKKSVRHNEESEIIGRAWDLIKSSSNAGPVLCNKHPAVEISIFYVCVLNFWPVIWCSSRDPVLTPEIIMCKACACSGRWESTPLLWLCLLSVANLSSLITFW